jgi:Fuc2NAc and GlcNAc transferase
MSARTLALAIAVTGTSLLLTAAVRRLAIRHGMLDMPNVRSSHRAATPRGGGLAIVLSASAAFAGLALAGGLPPQLLWVLLGGGGAIACVGLVDDRRPVNAPTRLAVHLLAAVWAVYWLGGLPVISMGAQVIHLGWVGDLVAALAIMWTLNLFNFMDGIDGIAASEAVFVTLAVLPSLMMLNVAGGIATASLIVGSAALGFLRWNWPPAKIFMGDVGSGYVGFVIATLALATAGQRPVAAWIWLILGGVFFVDATVTLLRRLMRGERVHEAHRTHAYQWLARSWNNHRRVTLTVLAINLLWLLPCALWATLRPARAATITLVALAPLVALAVAAGAGRSENCKRALV